MLSEICDVTSTPSNDKLSIIQPEAGFITNVYDFPFSTTWDTQPLSALLIVRYIGDFAKVTFIFKSSDIALKVNS